MKLIRIIAVALLIGGTAFDAVALTGKEKVLLGKKQRNEECIKNLKNTMYVMLYKYASKNKGYLPAKNNFAGLKVLLKYGAAPQDFSCKASRSKSVKKVAELNEKSNAYLYFGGINLMQAEKKTPHVILMCDKPDSRHLNILLANGTVLQVNRNELKSSSAEGIVEYLRVKYKYPDKIYKALLARAKTIDKALNYSKK